MDIKQAKGCSECERCKTIDEQSDWLERVLEAVHIPLNTFLSITLLGSMIGTFFLAPVSLMIARVVVGAIVGFVCWMFFLFFLAIPSLFRQKMVGWPIMQFVENNELHSHLGHKNREGVVLYTRRYGPWRKTWILGLIGSYVVSRTARGMIKVRLITWHDQNHRNNWQIILPPDEAVMMFTAAPHPGTICQHLWAGLEAKQLCAELGAKIADQHQVIAESRDGLSRSPHGKGMREWLLALHTEAFVKAEAVWQPRQIGGNPFEQSAERISQVEAVLANRRRQRKSSLAVKAPSAQLSST